jgi:hypothetical protein
MPFKSIKQERWAHTPGGQKALGGAANVHEWDEATKGKKLPMYVKGSAPREASYAAGGPVLDRVKDFKKAPDTRFGFGQRSNVTKDDAKPYFGAFLDGQDKFTGMNLADSGTPANAQRVKPDEDWSKTHVPPEESTIREGDWKSLKPVKPRGPRG